MHELKRQEIKRQKAVIRLNNLKPAGLWYRIKKNCYSIQLQVRYLLFQAGR
jgi:hypothetical protein